MCSEFPLAQLLVRGINPLITTESEEVDLRDLQRAQRDLRFVVKYARHQKGDYNNAFNNLVS